MTGNECLRIQGIAIDPNSKRYQPRVLQQVQEVDANRVVVETGSSRARIVG